MNLFNHSNIRSRLSKGLGVAGLSLFVLGHAHAANIAFWSDYSTFPAPTVAAGHTITNVSAADIDAGALESYDVLVAGHIGSNTATTCAKLTEFLASGKGLVTEWNGATLLFQPSPGSQEPATNPCNLFAGNATGGQSSFGSNLPLQIVDTASPLVVGLSNPFAMSGGSEYVYQLTNLGAEWSVAATFDGGGTTFPAVISAAPVTGGCIALSPFDYFDAGFDGGTPQANMEMLLGNMVNWVSRGASGCGAVSPPVLTDDTATVSRTQPSTTNVLTNDEAGVTLDTTYALTLSDPASGALTYSGGQVVFTPTNSFAAPVTFQYQACNTRGLCSLATVTLTPQAVLPVLADDSFTVSRSAPTALDVLLNDEAGVTLDTSYALSLSNAAAGSLAYSGSQIQFTPTNAFTAPVTFQYQACSAASVCAIATVTLTPQAIAPTVPTPVPTLGGVALLLLSGTVAGSMGFMRRRKSN